MVERRRSKDDAMASEILAIARRDGLQPGARLVEVHLAAALGVSRGPVRAGLQRLAMAGVVSGQRNVGYVLARSTSSRSVSRVLTAAGALEVAYRAVAADRLEGRLPEHVTEAALMRRYDLRRPEVLRLLDRIASEGWVSRRPGYGWRFAEALTRADAYAEANAFRIVIEPAALAIPGYTLAADVIERLRDRQQRVLAGGMRDLTIAELFQTGCDFHEEIVRGAGNPFFVEALRRVNSIRRLFAYRMLRDHDRIASHIAEHLTILDLLAAGRYAAAAEHLRRHLSTAPATDTGREQQPLE